MKNGGSGGIFMELLIVRHADAVDADGVQILTDFERPLSSRGLKQAKKFKKSLKNLNWTPDLIFTSPLVRAKHTAQLVFPKLHSHPESYFEKSELKPGVQPATILSILEELPGKRISLFGHMPDVANLVCWFLDCPGSGIELDKCGSALLQFAGKPRQGAACLRWLLTPDWKSRS